MRYNKHSSRKMAGVVFHPNTCGERFVRIDRYGIAEAMISDSTSSTVTTSSVGGGATVVQQVVGNDIVFKTLVAGANITLTDGPNSIEIAASGGGGGGITTIAGAGGDETLVKVGTAPTAELKGLTAGTGISLTGGANDVTITVTNGGDTVTLANAGAGSTLVVDGTGPSLTTKSLTAGAGINFTVTANDIAIDAPAGATYSIADAGAGDETVINDGTGPAFLLKKLTAGTGITLTADATQITVDNVGAGTTPTFTAGVGDEELFDGSPLVTFTPTFKSLSAGAGITLGATADAITITNSAASAVYTLATDAAATGSSIVSTPSPTSADFRVRGVLAGAGITVGVVGADVVITNAGAGGVTSLASAGGTSIITDGTGPALEIKGVSEVGNFIHLRDTATAVRWDVVTAASSDRNGVSPPIETSDTPTITAGKVDCMVLGSRANAAADGCSVYGRDATITGTSSTNATAVGNAANVSQTRGTAVGSGASVTADRGSAFGTASLVSGEDGIGGGTSSTVSGLRAVGWGQGNIASGSDSVALGSGTRSIGDNSSTLGHNVRASGTGAVAVGNSDDNTVTFTPTNNSFVAGSLSGGTYNRYLATKSNLTILTALMSYTVYDTYQTNGTTSVTAAMMVNGNIRVASASTRTFNLPSVATMDAFFDTMGQNLILNYGARWTIRVETGSTATLHITGTPPSFEVISGATHQTAAGDYTLISPVPADQAYVYEFFWVKGVGGNFILTLLYAATQTSLTYAP
jgi:hypothetical protein